MSADTIPESIRRAAYIVASDIRHHIAHSEIELIKNDPAVTSMVAKAIHDAVMAERERCAGLLDGTAVRLRAERSGASAEIIASVLVECADVIRMPAAPKKEG